MISWYFWKQLNQYIYVGTMNCYNHPNPHLEALFYVIFRNLIESDAIMSVIKAEI